MKRKKIICVLAMMFLPSVMITAVPIDLRFQVGYVDPENDQPENKRDPIQIPEVSIDGYTLIFNTPCDGCELRIVDEENNLVYSVIIPASSSSLVLPSNLSGEYELQIISGTICFYTEIEL